MATISHHHVITSTAGLRACGMNADPLYARAAIHPKLLEDDRKRIHTDQVAQLFKSVMESQEHFSIKVRSPRRENLNSSLTWLSIEL